MINAYKDRWTVPIRSSGDIGKNWNDENGIFKMVKEGKVKEAVEQCLLQSA